MDAKLQLPQRARARVAGRHVLITRLWHGISLSYLIRCFSSTILFVTHYQGEELEDDETTSDPWAK